jgi:hypothetical protein
MLWRVPQRVIYRYTIYNPDGSVRCVIVLAA